ncbi:MAG TPA: hypothetical protein VHK64_02555 [Nocardioidaceae bacterium]|nr:hypothetical protein [Nocardioidaceae bacterium]
MIRTADYAPKWARTVVYRLRGGWTDWRWFDRLYDKHPKIGTWLCDHVADTIELHAADRVAALVCRRYGHLPEPDQCGMPQHDYCIGCNELTPGMAERPPDFAERWSTWTGRPCPWEFDGVRWVSKEEE